MPVVTQPAPESLNYYTPWQPLFVRPLAVTVIAWIGIVLGGLGLICGGLGLLMRQVMLARLSALGGVNISWATGQMVEMLVGLAQSTLLMLASLGCLYLCPAARRVMIGYAIFAIAWAVGILLMRHVVWRGVAPANPDAAAINALMLCVGLLLSCALPVAILLVMTRSHVRIAFATRGMTWYASGYQPPPPAPVV